MTRRTVRAAGGVLWRHGHDAPEVALVHRPRYDDWSVPKGKAKPGEHVLATALREVVEETGHRLRLGPFLGRQRYRVLSGGSLADKIVDYWTMQAVGGEFTANDEVDELLWLPADEAYKHVRMDNDHRILAAFAHASLDTAALAVVRHGPMSVTRSRKGHPKTERPLDPRGHTQADRLVPLLDAIGVAALRSAAGLACMQMLTPYAEHAGLVVEVDPALSGRLDPGQLDAGVKDMLAAATAGSLAVCGRRELVDGLVRAAGRSSRHPAPKRVETKKGGWWLVHHRAGQVVSVESHLPAA